MDKTGGFTAAGAAANRAAEKLEFSRTSNDNWKRRVGVLQRLYYPDAEANPQYIYVVWFDAANSPTGEGFSIGPISLKPRDEDSAMIGLPEQLIGQQVEVVYTGTSAARGEATLINSRKRNPAAARIATQVRQNGTSFAFPGSGLPF